MLILGTFKLIYELKKVDARTKSLIIKGIEDYLIKNFFNSDEGLKIKNLLRRDIKVVNQFYINIILGKHLDTARVQYNSLNSILRFRLLKINIVIATLIKRYNLTFIKYNKTNAYSPILIIVSVVKRLAYSI